MARLCVHLVLTGGGTITGGVSTHVRSLQSGLSAKGWSINLTTPRQLVSQGRRLAVDELAHFHVSHPSGLRILALFLLICWLGPKRCLITFHHGPSVERYAHTRFDRFWLGLILSQVRAAVCLTGKFQQFAQELAPSARLIAASSYVGPLRNGLSSAPRPIPFHACGDVHLVRRWVLSSGYETELYGFRETTAAIAASQDAALLGYKVCTYGPANDVFMQTVLDLAYAKQIPVEWYRGLTGSAFMALLNEDTVYVRNTSGDTFGLAVAEALEAGSHVIATDVCARPEGVALIPPHDSDALRRALDYLADSENRSGPTPANSMRTLAKLGESSLKAVESAYLLPASGFRENKGQG